VEREVLLLAEALGVWNLKRLHFGRYGYIATVMVGIGAGDREQEKGLKIAGVDRAGTGYMYMCSVLRH
jgi:hypothetical protein